MGIIYDRILAAKKLSWNETIKSAQASHWADRFEARLDKEKAHREVDLFMRGNAKRLGEDSEE